MGELALRAQEWESRSHPSHLLCGGMGEVKSPSLSPAVALGRTDPTPCLDSIVELILDVGESALRVGELVPPPSSAVWWWGNVNMPSPLPLQPPPAEEAAALRKEGSAPHLGSTVECTLLTDGREHG